MAEELPIQIDSTAETPVEPKGAVTGGPKPQLSDAEIMQKLGIKEETIEDAHEKMFGKKDVQETEASTPDEQNTETEQEAEAPEAGDSDLDEAWKALERDGWSKSDLKKLSRNRILELGSKRAKVQADVDKAYSDLKSLKSKKTETNPTASEADSADVGDLLSGFAEFEKNFLPEDAKAFRSVIEPLAKEIVGLRKLAQEYVSQSGARESARIRDAATKLYPELKDDLAWDAVRSAARELVDEVGDAEQALQAAVRRVYGDRQEKKPGPIKNVATVPNRTVPPKQVSRDEKEFMAFAEVLRGNKDKARQIWGS